MKLLIALGLLLIGFAAITQPQRDSITVQPLPPSIISGTVVTPTAITFGTNLWAGPSNPVPLTVSRQWYDTYTPCNFSGITGKSTTTTASTLVTIRNIAATNIAVTFTNGFCPTNITSYIVTSGYWAKFSIEYDPNPAGTGSTNEVPRHF